MLRRVLLAVVLLAVLLAGARVLSACSAAAWDPNDVLQNEIVRSGNGRFVAVIRAHEDILDFETRLAGELMPYDPPAIEDEGEPSPAPPPTVTIALYEITPKGRMRVAQIPVEAATAAHLLIANDGTFVAGVAALHGMCGWAVDPKSAFVAVYDTTGARRGSLSFADVFDDYDLLRIHDDVAGDAEAQLLREANGRDVLVLSVPGPRDDRDHLRPGRRRVDLQTVTLLDAKTPIFPPPRVYVTPADGALSAEPMKSFEPCDVAWGDREVVPLKSDEFYARVMNGPLPPFPAMAIRARVRGTVRLEVLVSERGHVLCTRASSFPFGIDKAFAAAAMAWTFAPMSVDGHRVKFSGALLFHLRDAPAPVK